MKFQWNGWTMLFAVLGNERRFGLLNKNRELIRPVSAEEKAEIREAAKEITERSITLVRDEDHKLPLSLEKDKKLLLVAVTPVAHKGNVP